MDLLSVAVVVAVGQQCRAHRQWIHMLKLRTKSLELRME